MQRSYLLFLESIKSKASQKTYQYHLDRFMKWIKIKDYDSLLKVDDHTLQTMLEDYVFHLKKNVSPNSIESYLKGIEHFLIINDRELKFKKLHKLYPERKKPSGQESYSTEQIRKMISFAVKKRSRALIFCLCSTGARIGALSEPMMKDLVDVGFGCRAIRLYTDSVEEAWCFLTPEANRTLEDYFEERRKDGERFTPDTPVFRAEYQIGIEKVRPTSKKTLEGIIYRIIQRAGIERVKIGSRYNIQADHGFRKWYKTKIALTQGISSEMSKKLIQHSDLEGRYTTPTIQELFEVFRKAISNLTIDNQEKLKAELAEKEIKRSEFEEMKRKQEESDRLIKKLAKNYRDLKAKQK